MTEQATGYKTRDILLEENKVLRQDKARLETERDDAGNEIERLQEALRVANESLAASRESHQQSEEMRVAQRLELIESEKVRLGCTDHPFRPEGKLQKGHVHVEDDGTVLVYCSRGHFDRWYTG